MVSVATWPRLAWITKGGGPCFTAFMAASARTQAVRGLAWAQPGQPRWFLEGMGWHVPGTCGSMQMFIVYLDAPKAACN